MGINNNHSSVEYIIVFETIFFLWEETTSVTFITFIAFIASYIRIAVIGIIIYYSYELHVIFTSDVSTYTKKIPLWHLGNEYYFLFSYNIAVFMLQFLLSRQFLSTILTYLIQL